MWLPVAPDAKSCPEIERGFWLCWRGAAGAKRVQRRGGGGFLGPRVGSAEILAWAVGRQFDLHEVVGTCRRAALRKECIQEVLGLLPSVAPRYPTPLLRLHIRIIPLEYTGLWEAGSTLVLA